MLDKGSAAQGVVESVRNIPAKNPAWDSRWEIVLLSEDPRYGHRFLVGNKGLTQQLGRMGADDPSSLVGLPFTFERTSEGYLNIVNPGGRLKPGTNVLAPVPLTQDGAPSAPRPSAAPKPPRNPNADFRDDLPFDEPVEGEANPARDAEEAKAKRLVAARLEVEGELMWALGMAEAQVREKVGKPVVEREMVRVDEDGEPMFDEDGNAVNDIVRDVPALTGDEVRAMYALAATYHISVKDKLRGY